MDQRRQQTHEWLADVEVAQWDVPQLPAAA